MEFHATETFGVDREWKKAAGRGTNGGGQSSLRFAQGAPEGTGGNHLKGSIVVMMFLSNCLSENCLE
jgi:hypothetical protein